MLIRRFSDDPDRRQSTYIFPFRSAVKVSGRAARAGHPLKVKSLDFLGRQSRSKSLDVLSCKQKWTREMTGQRSLKLYSSTILTRHLAWQKHLHSRLST